MLKRPYWHIKFVRLFTALAKDKYCIYLDRLLAYVITITVNIVVLQMAYTIFCSLLQTYGINSSKLKSYTSISKRILLLFRYAGNRQCHKIL